jgi:hypothetical protein
MTILIDTTTASPALTVPVAAFAAPKRSKLPLRELFESQRERRLCRAAIVLGSLATLTAIVGIVLVAWW